jgi:hypothetical protein
MTTWISAAVVALVVTPSYAASPPAGGAPPGADRGGDRINPVFVFDSYSVGFTGPNDDEPDDRLSPEDRRLTRELTERGMPELVEALLSDHPTMHRVYIARAYARAALDTPDADLRERFYKAAEEEYYRVIALEDDSRWLRGLRRSFDVVQWRVELADLILRHWMAPQLDRFEITSGLDFDRRRLSEKLDQAHEHYRDAAQALDALFFGLRTDEERFLLLGLGEKITTLYEHRRLNAAWAAVYLAMVGEAEDSDRANLLGIALSAFDAVARTTMESSRKYNALIGAGIALRESGRYSEADAAFDRVVNSTASLGLTARARYEKARSLMAAGRFDPARRELDQLAAISARRLTDGEAGGAFYIRLAPLIHAYTYALQARNARGGAARKERLTEKAASALGGISTKGGIWPGIVRVYLEAMLGTRRNLSELTASELRVVSSQAMAEEDYPRAIEALGLLLDRGAASDRHAEARFNLGICHFQLDQPRPAAEAFLAVALEEDAADLAERATEYAYRCWRQVAHASKDGKDYLRLAQAAELLGERFADNELADEAAWVAALAWQEGGDYESALRAYLEVPRQSANYWPARRNAARCRQRLYEALPPEASSRRRARAARNAAHGWVRLSEDLAAVEAAESPGEHHRQQVPGVGSLADRDSWITSARLSAAVILAGDDARAYREGLALLADRQPTARVLALRIRCHRGLGDLGMAKRVLNDYLGQAPGAEAGAVLIDMAAEMEAEVSRLRQAGRRQDAIRAAEQSIPTIRQLLDWIKTQPAHQKYVPVVRFSLVKALWRAHRRDEAMVLLQQLLVEDPGNGGYVRLAALLQEDVARSAGDSDRRAALDRAESFWAMLLKDPTLREHAPAEYWEARYHWLRHQLRHGHKGEVIRGIETEKVWHPDLGGPPWQARLLELAEQARAAEETQGS